ncbi:glycosyltransferase [Lentzea sp. NPDC060358]|uniref:glycosyltransferase n=1 Tax=Lentzea sp. NPDC060358 TaxID=3347103 RepID=UPI0036557DBB
MRIAVISVQDDPSAPPRDRDAAGRPHRVAKLTEELRRLGHELTVHTRRTGGSPPDRPGVVHVPAGPARPLGQDDVVPHLGEFARFLSARWEEAPPDVVHAHHWTSGLAAVLATRGTPIPIVLSYHGLAGGDSAGIERLVGRGAAGIVTTSGQETADLVRLGVRRSRISTVPWGVDTAVFTPHGPATPRTGRVRVLAAGDLTPRAGLDDLVVALALVSSTELVVAGGPDRRFLPGNAEHARLAELAARHAVADRVSFIGHVPHAEMPALIRSADVVACPQRQSSFGVVALEAMACGVPVVASAVGGLAESVVHRVTGLHVPPHSPALLARALRLLLGDEVRRRELGAAGHDRVHLRHTWDRVAREVVRAYDRAAGPEVITAQREPEQGHARQRRARAREERGR